MGGVSVCRADLFAALPATELTAADVPAVPAEMQQLSVDNQLRLVAEAIDVYFA